MLISLNTDQIKNMFQTKVIMRINILCYVHIIKIWRNFTEI